MNEHRSAMRLLPAAGAAALLAAVLLVVALLAAACAPAQSPTRSPASPVESPSPGKQKALLVLPSASTPVAQWMEAHGWERQRGRPRLFRVDRHCLLMVSRDDSVAIGLKRGFPLQPKTWPRVRFKIRVDTLPKGTDLARKGGDDAAFRLYVAFDRGGGWFSPPHTVAYTWTERTPVGRVIQSAHFDNLRYLSVGRGLPPKDKDGAAKWIVIERDLAADYRLAFPEAAAPVPAISGILLKCDSNNTGTSARAAVAEVVLLGPQPG